VEEMIGMGGKISCKAINVQGFKKIDDLEKENNLDN
jgi:hypothetical protein